MPATLRPRLLALATALLLSPVCAETKLPFDFASLSGTWRAEADDNLLAPRTVLVGERGLALRGRDVGDFTFVIRLRFDELRYQARVPASGIAFAARDRRHLASVVLDPNSGQLRLLRTVEGRTTQLAASAGPAHLPTGEWFWLTVRRQRQQLVAALSRDGRTWVAALEATLPADLGPGRLGVVADLPETRFDLAPPPARALRDRYEWRQTLDGTVTRFLREETFAPATGLTRSLRPVTFPPGVTSVAVESLTLRHFQPGDPTASTPTWTTGALPPAPSAVDYRATLDRVGQALPRDGYRLLGAALATATEPPSPALREELQEGSQRLLTAFRQRGDYPRGFSSVYPAFRILHRAQRLGLLTEADGPTVKALATAALTGGAFERGAMNRALGMAAAIRPGLELAPDHPERAALERTRALVLQDFVAHDHQPLEDSTNYRIISLFFSLCLVLDDPALDWAAAPGWRAAFDDLLAQIGPDGTVPAYGDDHPSHPGMLIGLLEAAARLWQEPIFRGAAARIYDRHFAHGRLPVGLVGEDYLGLGLAAAQVDESLAAKPAPAEPLLQHRARDGAPSKIVLTAESASGSDFFLFDLLSGTEHGHQDSLALVGAVAQGRALLPDAGRYARSGQFHNRLGLAETPADFPLRANTGEQTRRMVDPTPPPGVWQAWRLPLRSHWVWGNFEGDLGLPALAREQYHPDIPADYRYDPASQWALLLEVKGEGAARFEVTGARLTGGTAPDRDLSRFPSAWPVTFRPQSTYLGAVLDGPLALGSGDHGWLEFQLRVTPEAGSTALVNSVVIGDADGYPKRFVPPDSPAAEVDVTAWQVTPWGAQATLTTTYFTSTGQSLPVTRHLTYVAGRVLALRDTITNPTASTFTVGPVWHVADARLAPDGETTLATGLRLRFGALAGSEITLRQHAIPGVLARQVLAQGASLAPGQTRTFDTLLIPPSSLRPEVHLDGDHLIVDSSLNLALPSAP